MGPAGMGQHPVKVAITSHDTGSVTFEHKTGFLWWRETHTETIECFAAAGIWYSRASGWPVLRWAQQYLNCAHRVHMRRVHMRRVKEKKRGGP